MKITLKQIGKTNNKVAAIKALRCITRLGLKEAKDAIESVMSGSVITVDAVGKKGFDSVDDRECLRTLTAEGIGVITGGGKRSVILSATRTNAKMAVEDGDYDLAISLINVLKEHDFV